MKRGTILLADACPDRASLEEYVSGGKTDSILESHLASCEACSVLVDQLRSENDFLREFAGANLERFEGVDAGNIPQQVPGYRLIREIHRGGQGVVWLAEQEGTRRRVAVKMLLQGRFATTRQRVRFEREIEVIASLKHPGIVTVFESGESDDGQVYYAMEYVEGERLDEWWLRERPGSSDAARMVYEISDAIGFAHRRGVIHRDIKPANILIDSKGKPNILDFGLARLVEDHDSDRGQMLATAAGEFLGTFAYAAPEQLTGDPDSVDTRADVYALGIVLFESLTQTSPFPKVESVADLVHSRIEGVVPRPSSRAKGVGQELDLITLKALDPTSERRYDSASEFAEDIGRWLEGRPIQARGDSLPYVLRKAIGRHKLASWFVATVAILVMGSAVSLIVLYGISEEKRRQAERAVETIEMSLKSLDSESKGPMPKTISELLEVLEGNVRDQLEADPEIASRLYLIAGKAYLSIPETQAADRALSAARAITMQGLIERGEQYSLELARITHNLGRVYFFYGVSARKDAAAHRRAGRMEEAKSAQEMTRKWFIDSVKTYANALDIREYLLDEPHFDIAMTTQHLAAAYRELAVNSSNMLDRIDAGEEVLSPSYTRERLEYSIGEFFDLSESTFMHALEKWQELYGESSPQVASVINALARTSRVRGDLERARDRYIQAYEMVLQHGTREDDFRVGRAAKNVGMAYRSLGQFDQSIEWLTEAATLLQLREGDLSDRVLESKQWLADSMLQSGLRSEDILDITGGLQTVAEGSDGAVDMDSRIDIAMLHADAVSTIRGRIDAQRELERSTSKIAGEFGAEVLNDPRIRAREIYFSGDSGARSDQIEKAMSVSQSRTAQ